MKHSVIGISFFLVFFSSFSLLASKAEKQDCSCEPITWQQSFEQSTHVVFGEVKAVKIHNDDLATGMFQAMETFKGDAGFIKQLVGSAKKEASCRKVLMPGYYIVYANEAENVVLNPCVASRQLQDDLVQTLTQIKQYANSKTEAVSSSTSGQKVNSAQETDWFQSIIDWFHE